MGKVKRIHSTVYQLTFYYYHFITIYIPLLGPLHTLIPKSSNSFLPILLPSPFSTIFTPPPTPQFTQTLKTLKGHLIKSWPHHKMTVSSLAKVGGLSKRRGRETMLFYPPRPPDAFEDVWHHQGQDHGLLQQFLGIRQVCNIIPGQKRQVQRLIHSGAQQTAGAARLINAKTFSFFLPPKSGTLYICSLSLAVGVNKILLDAGQEHGKLPPPPPPPPPQRRHHMNTEQRAHVLFNPLTARLCAWRMLGKSWADYVLTLFFV